MNVYDLRAALTEYGVKTTSKMRKSELESLYADVMANVAAPKGYTVPLSLTVRERNYIRQNGYTYLTMRQERQIRKTLKRDAKRFGHYAAEADIS